MKIWNPKDTMIGFKLETKTQPLRDTKKLEFQTLKDTTSTPAILLHNTPRGIAFKLVNLTVPFQNFPEEHAP